MTVQELFKAAQELTLADQVRLASQLMQSVVQKMQLTAHEHTPQKQVDDPIIGLFSGSPDLASRSEEILTQAVSPTSGFSWKA
jgi:hypothetical protein